MMRKVSEEELEGLPSGVTYIETQEDGIIVEVDGDATEYGIPASWDDVLSLNYFDLQIGTNLYSWRRTPGHYHIGMKGNEIGLVRYSAVHANGREIGKTKKTIVPDMLGNPALQIIDGYLAVNGQSYADTPFYDVSSGEVAQLSDIKRIRDDVEYSIPVKPYPEVDEFSDAQAPL